jgi:hypothetical protein
MDRDRIAQNLAAVENHAHLISDVFSFSIRWLSSVGRF